jgi:hypothetical protein
MANEKQIVVTDPDGVPETLCAGPFNLASGPGPLVTLTFTHPRGKTGNLFQENRPGHELIVRARIVTTTENLAALRDLLNATLKSLTPPAKGSDFKVN